MIRLTLILAAVIFAVLVIVPGEEDISGGGSGETPATERPSRALVAEGALRETDGGRLVLVTVEGEEIPIDLVVEPAELTEEDARAPQAAGEPSAGGADVPAGPEATGAEQGTGTETPATPEPPATANEGSRVRVTGDRVNFRAGPTTDAEILAAVDLGTELELIERVADGWAHLRVPETGLTGYMSADFLEPAN